MLQLSRHAHSDAIDSVKKEDSGLAYSSNELPVLRGIKDADNSSLKLDISDITLQKLRKMN